MTYKIYGGPRASEAFLNILMGSGGAHSQCGCCGREHWAVDNPDLYDFGYDDEAKKDAENKRAYIMSSHEDDPDGVVLHRDVDYIESKTIDGQSIVVDCACNGLARYEKFFWENRNLWKEYLVMRKLRAQAVVDDIGDVNNWAI